MAQPRNADSRSKGNAVEDKNLITHERAHQSKFLNETQIPDKMIERVSEASRGKYCGNQSKLAISFEIPQERRVEENIHQQFLVIIVKAIEKLRDRAGRQRPISISQGVETRHPAARDKPMPPDGKIHYDFEKTRDEARPAGVPR